MITFPATRIILLLAMLATGLSCQCMTSNSTVLAETLQSHKGSNVRVYISGASSDHCFVGKVVDVNLSSGVITLDYEDRTSRGKYIIDIKRIQAIGIE